MSSRSRVFHRILLVLMALAVFAIAAWVGMRFIEPVPPPPVPPAKANVSFDPRVDVRSHPLFNTLQALTRGSVVPQTPGRTNPFLGSTGGEEALAGEEAMLGTVEEVRLGGATVQAVSKGAEHGVLVLVRLPGQSNTYEIRRLTGGESPQGLANWTLAPGETALVPVALQEDRTGTIWLLSAGGRIGSIQGDGKPLWGSLPLDGALTSVQAARASFALDGAGRLWLTDGASVFVGNGIGFERINVSAQLSAANREALGIPAAGDTPTALLVPQRLAMLTDGRVAVVMDRLVALFPLSLQGGAEIVVSLGVTVAVEPGGALWSVVRGNDGAVRAWVRTFKDGSREYTDPVVLPKQAGEAPRLAAVNTGTLYALDYVPGASILWSILGDTWVANVLAPKETQPQDRADQLVADRDGNVWALMSQKGLLLIRPSR